VPGIWDYPENRNAGALKAGASTCELVQTNHEKVIVGEEEQLGGGGPSSGFDHKIFVDTPIPCWR